MAKTGAAAGSTAPNGGAEGAAPAKTGMKKIMLIVAVIALLVAIGLGGMLYMKKTAAAAAAAAVAAADGDPEEQSEPVRVKKPVQSANVDLNHPPVFVPLEPFIVNLADKESDRYAQIAITLQVDDVKFAEQVKAYMPAIRNSILMVLAHKTSQELLDRVGKEALAEEIMREAVRPMGIHIEVDTDDISHAADKGESPRRKKSGGRAREVYNPIQQVHFSNFIIQ